MMRAQNLKGDSGRTSGMRKISVIMLAAWLSSAMSCKSTVPGALASEKSVSTATGTYLALGDSYTIGVSVAEADRFPIQLSAAVEGLEKPTIVARNGWTTADLHNGIEVAGIPGKKYDLVTLLIGVNNEFQGRSVTEYEEQLIQLVKQAIVFAGNMADHVIVLSIPDYGFTPYGQSEREHISPRIDQFNRVNKRVSNSLKVHYADITGISRKGLDDAELVTTDGLHPSGKQYGLWVQTISGTVTAILQQ